MSSLPAWFVVLMGIGTVFAGLTCIVLICSVFGWVFSLSKKKKSTPPGSLSDPASEKEIKPFVAAVSAAIAEESGTDPACVRILSIKKI